MASNEKFSAVSHNQMDDESIENRNRQIQKQQWNQNENETETHDEMNKIKKKINEMSEWNGLTTNNWALMRDRMR